MSRRSFVHVATTKALAGFSRSAAIIFAMLAASDYLMSAAAKSPAPYAHPDSGLVGVTAGNVTS